MPGMSVQGFVLVAIGTVLVGSLLMALPLGTVLDPTAPGLLFGMTIGRFGCLLGGCCVGRPTSSRWGVWSSDRRLGTRRIPVQLLESSIAGILGALTLLAVLEYGVSARGLVFVAGIAAYTAGRQVIFPLRGIPRATVHGRMITLSSASLVALAGHGDAGPTLIRQPLRRPSRDGRASTATSPRFDLVVTDLA